MYAQTGRICRITTLRSCTSIRPGAAIEPVSARGAAVVAQPGKAGKLLAGLPLIRRRQLIVLEIGQRFPVDLLGHFRERRIVWIAVWPVCIQNRIRELAALFLIERSHSKEYPGQDFLVQLGVS